MLIPLLLIAFLPTAAFESENIDTLVICPTDFQVALQPWVRYRQQQGYKIAVRPPASSADGIKSLIGEYVQSGNLKNVVLVGDSADANVRRDHLVPTDFVDARVNVKFGSEAEIATDHTYADLDGDYLVDLNIGRMPVDNERELTNYIQRVMAYESNHQLGSWQRRVNFVAGVGGFGQLIDKVIEQSVKKIVTDLIPPECDVSMTYGSWRSPYCPDPMRFSETAISRFNRGCQFWVYVGHGQRRQLDKVRLPDRRLDILNTQSVNQLAAQQGSPIAILLSCYSAATDDPQDGLAELMIKQPAGPIGVISSTRVSMPYAMGIFSLEMLDGFYKGQTATLGELVQQSKRKLVQFDENKSRYHQLVASMGKSFSPEPGLLTDERHEHVHLMHLLADPLLQLHRPSRLKLVVPESANAGQTITVQGQAERDGKLTLDLSYRRDRFRQRPPRRKHYQGDRDSFARYHRVYQQTQNLTCMQKTIQVPAGSFSVELPVPQDSSGACHVRGMLVGNRYFAMGSSDVQIEKPIAVPAKPLKSD